jgi:hypothetical protein
MVNNFRCIVKVIELWLRYEGEHSSTILNIDAGNEEIVLVPGLSFVEEILKYVSMPSGKRNKFQILIYCVGWTYVLRLKTFAIIGVELTLVTKPQRRDGGLGS